jgi:hypothetical protein
LGAGIRKAVLGIAANTAILSAVLAVVACAYVGNLLLARAKAGKQLNTRSFDF